MANTSPVSTHWLRKKENVGFALAAGMSGSARLRKAVHSLAVTKFVWATREQLELPLTRPKRAGAALSVYPRPVYLATAIWPPG